MIESAVFTQLRDSLRSDMEISLASGFLGASASQCEFAFY